MIPSHKPVLTGALPNVTGGGHGRAAACGRGQERSLEGGRRGGSGKQRRPGRPRQRAERTGIADQHDDRKHEPTGQNPGAADRNRSRRGVLLPA
jgi:hypothetical protein